MFQGVESLNECDMLEFNVLKVLNKVVRMIEGVKNWLLDYIN